MSEAAAEADDVREIVLRGDETLEELRAIRSRIVGALDRARATGTSALAHKARRESESASIGTPGRRVLRSIEADYRERRARAARFITSAEAVLRKINSGIRILAEKFDREARFVPHLCGIKTRPDQSMTYVFLARFRRGEVAREEKVSAELGFDEQGRLIGIRLPGVFVTRELEPPPKPG